MFRWVAVPLVGAAVAVTLLIFGLVAVASIGIALVVMGLLIAALAAVRLFIRR
jgi:hypothetical protein